MRLTIGDRGLRGMVCAAALMGLLAGCGGGSDTPAANNTPNNTGGNSPPAQIQGVATPSTVSVVTATNAD